MVALLGATNLSRFGVIGVLVIAGPLAILGASYAASVRGYLLTDTALRVQRPGRLTDLPLAGLQKVEGQAEALAGSIRLFGNGGLFVIAGLFWNRRLGRYRAYATDPGRAVVLTWVDRKVVITPHDPQHFILRVRTLLATKEFPR